MATTTRNHSALHSVRRCGTCGIASRSAYSCTTTAIGRGRYGFGTIRIICNRSSRIFKLQFYTDPEEPIGKSEVTYYLDQQDAINQINSEFKMARQWARRNLFYDKTRVEHVMKSKPCSKATRKWRSVSKCPRV